MPPLCSALGALLIQVRVGETTPGPGYLQVLPEAVNPVSTKGHGIELLRYPRSRRPSWGQA